MAVDVIRGTDREFTMRIIRSSSEEPFDFTGIAGTNLALKLPGESSDLELTLTPNANGSKLEVVSAVGGKVKAVISDLDTVLLKPGSGLGMELTIKEGAGPDYLISKVQFGNALNVLNSLFES